MCMWIVNMYKCDIAKISFDKCIFVFIICSFFWHVEWFSNKTYITLFVLFESYGDDRLCPWLLALLIKTGEINRDIVYMHGDSPA